MASSTLCNLLLVFSPCKEVGHDCAGFETSLYPLELNSNYFTIEFFQLKFIHVICAKKIENKKLAIDYVNPQHCKLFLQIHITRLGIFMILTGKVGDHTEDRG